MIRLLLIALLIPSLALGQVGISIPGPSNYNTPTVPTDQYWTGTLANERATDWTLAGVEGGIPSSGWMQCGGTIAAYTGSGGTIQSAIDACGDNEYVLLGAGTFTLSSGFSLDHNMAVRGSGSNSTILVINGETINDTCGYFYTAAIGFCTSSSPVPETTANWTAGYALGTTRITLSASSGVVAGTILRLNQLNEASDGYPAAGDIYICTTASTSCVAQGGGYGFGVAGRATSQLVKVTNVVGGNVFDITPPISIPDFRSGQTPQAVWASSAANILTNAGIEDMSLTFTGLSGSDAAGLEITNTLNCWVRGVRTVYSSSNRHYTSIIINSLFFTFQDSYLYDPSTILIASYPISPNNSGSLLIQNNIFQTVTIPIVVNGPMQNSVIAYNFAVGSSGPMVAMHGGGDMKNLLEGNVATSFWTDANHGTHALNTTFRNAFIGTRYGPACPSVCTPLQIQSFGRLFNHVGNVMGDASVYSVYQSLLTWAGNVIYILGWQGNASGQIPPTDAYVASGLLRWGNWDQVTSTDDNTDGDQTGTRWCGDSGNTNWAKCTAGTEVPSTLTSYANEIPANESFADSFYLSAKPAWVDAMKPWPLIGPDVSGGLVADLGGHLVTTPAMDCYLDVMSGPSDGSGSVLAYDWTMCY